MLAIIRFGSNIFQMRQILLQHISTDIHISVMMVAWLFMTTIKAPDGITVVVNGEKLFVVYFGAKENENAVHAEPTFSFCCAHVMKFEYAIDKHTSSSDIWTL